MGNDAKIIAPKTQLQAEQPILWEQRDFSGGMFADIPASEIPNNGLAYAKNLICFDTSIEGRTGSKAWSDLDYPSYPGFTGMTVSKIGNQVYWVAGPLFTYAINRRYIVISGRHYEIINIDSPTILTTRDAGDVAITAGCWVRSKLYAWDKHEKQKRIIMQIDDRIFITQYSMTSWIECVGLSYQYPSESESTISEFDEFSAILHNEMGHFKIRLDTNEPYYYKMNTGLPTVLITGNDQTNIYKYGRRYSYCMSKIVGSYHLSRMDAGTFLEQESASCQPDSNTYKDYGEVFTVRPVGDSSETYGVLTGGTDNGAGITFNQNWEDWATLADATFGICVNNEGTQTIMCDFTGVQSMEDVRRIIEEGIKVYWPTVVVTQEKTNTGLPYWQITTGKYNGYYFGSAYPGPAPDAYLTTIAGIGTDISTLDAVSACGMLGTVGCTNMAVSNITTYTEPGMIFPIRSAGIVGSTTIRERHWTHYSLYASKDSGPEGTDPITGIGNNPELLIFVDDFPRGKSFYGSKAATNIVTITQGRFSEDDIGCNIQFGDGGNIYPIATYINTNSVTVTDPGAAVEAAIEITLGAGSVHTFTQVGNTLTRLTGPNLTINNEGMPIFWSDGTITHINNFVDANTATVLEFASKTNLAATLDPQWRVYYDTTSDNVLDTRIGQDLFILQQRTWTYLPNNTNLGAVVPGYLIVAQTSKDTVYYSQTGQKYRAGYYHPTYQFDNSIKDGITTIHGYQDKCIVTGYHTTWGTATNTSQIKQNDKTGLFTSVLQRFSLLDDIGVIHTKSIAPIGIDTKIMITSEPAVRIFDGFKYSSENLGIDRVMSYIEKLASKVIGFYNYISGYYLWGANEEEGD